MPTVAVASVGCFLNDPEEAHGVLFANGAILCGALVAGGAVKLEAVGLTNVAVGGG